MVSEEFNFGSEIRLNTVLCFKINLAGFLIFNTSKSEHSWLISWVFIGDDKISWKVSTLQNISSPSDLTVCKMQLNNNTIFRLTNNVQYSALLFKLQIFTSVCFSSAQILLHHGLGFGTTHYTQTCWSDNDFSTTCLVGKIFKNDPRLSSVFTVHTN